MQPLRTHEYHSILEKYDKMQDLARQIAIMQRDLNNFFSQKSEDLYNNAKDYNWASNDTAITEQFVENITNIHKLADKEISNN